MTSDTPRRLEPLAGDGESGRFEFVGDPVLPDERFRLLEEHLMQEIDPTPRLSGAPHAGTPARAPSGRLRRRLAWTVPVPLAALAIAGVVAFGPLGDDRSGSAAAAPHGARSASVVRVLPGTTTGLSAAVDRISHTAAMVAPVPKPGQFVYVETRVSWRVNSGNNGAWVQDPHIRRFWSSPDGKRSWIVDPPDFPAPGRGFQENGEPGPGTPAYTYLTTLPTDPDALLAVITAGADGDNPAPQRAFAAIGDLLDEAVLPPGLAGALYRAAARIPGVVLVPESADLDGRTGIALALENPNNGSRTEWIFDRDNYEFLGQREVVTRAKYGQKVGTVVAHTAVLKRMVVDTMPGTPGTPGTQGTSGTSGA